jgi:hypothetical protein
MSKQIKPTYVTSEQGKLLKEKGFIEGCNYYYELALTSKKDKQDGYSGSFGWEKGECNLQNGYFINNWKDCDYSGKHWFMCSAPEQSVVCEWLLKTYSIYLWVEPYADRKTFQPYWVYMNEKSKEAPLKYHLSGNASIGGSDYKTPQEAYSAAFDYILKEL